MTRRPLFVALLAMLAVVTAACGPNQPADDDDDGQGAPAGSPGGTQAAAEVSGELFAFGFSYENGDTIAKSRVDVFTEANPDVDVQFSESGFEAQPFLAALQSGDPPDVVNIPRNILGSYINRGVLQPLDDCLAQQGMDTGIFREAALSQTQVDGTTYALPEFFNTRLWIINNAAFEEAGLDAATFDFSDWDAIAEANQQLLQVEGSTINRIGIDPKIPEFFEMWVRANGAQIISEDGRESLLEDPAVAEALEYTVGLVEAHGSAAAFTDFRNTWDFFGANNQVAADQIGAWPMEQWYLNVLAENSPEAEITGVPFVTQEGDITTISDGNSWAIVEGTDNPDAACAFVTTMVATDTWIASAEARQAEREEEGLPFTGTYTANSEADDIIFGEMVDLSDTPAFQDAVDAVLESQDSAFAFPPSPAGEEFTQALQDAVNAALTGEDPAAALQAADEEAQAAIDAAAE
ncbi:MAG TPA: extracellular solute-binding protein [Candidatus Limnocylindria bacterium]|nr:extracellular solute-binding protein [Candidatus Limnocylindria bacterium]